VDYFNEMFYTSGFVDKLSNKQLVTKFSTANRWLL